MSQITHLLLLLLISYAANSSDPSHQMNGPENIVYSGVGNIANGANSFRGDNITANQDLNDFTENKNKGTFLANQIHDRENESKKGYADNADGEQNKTMASFNDVSAEKNEVKDLNTVFGEDNKIFGPANQASEQSNQVKGSKNTIRVQNTVRGEVNTVIGDDQQEDKQKMIDNIQKMILSRLSQRLGS